MARIPALILHSRFRCLLHSSTMAAVSSSSSSSSIPPAPAGPPPPQELDFLKATDVLFSEEPKKKKFGWDFHLWQLFVACLPPLAVYLTAQYARYEIRRMEKERGIPPKDKKEQQKALEAKRPSARTLHTPVASGHDELVKSKDLQTFKDRLEAIEKKIMEMEDQKVMGSSPATTNPKQQEDIAKKEGDDPSQPTNKVIPVSGGVNLKAAHSTVHKEETKQARQDTGMSQVGSSEKK